MMRPRPAAHSATMPATPPPSMAEFATGSMRAHDSEGQPLPPSDQLPPPRMLPPRELPLPAEPSYSVLASGEFAEPEDSSGMLQAERLEAFAPAPPTAIENAAEEWGPDEFPAANEPDADLPQSIEIVAPYADREQMGSQRIPAARPLREARRIPQDQSVLTRGDSPAPLRNNGLRTTGGTLGGEGFRQDELPPPTLNRSNQDDGPFLSRQTVPDRSCDEFRKMLLDKSIEDIALDISPYRDANRDSSESEVALLSRTWRNRYGEPLGTGRMIDMKRGYVIIESATGEEKISTARLGDADLAAVAEFWNIPAQCTVGYKRFEGRHWVPQSYTWKASGLCHKPLYFENRQLERYGHSAGPFLQPVDSAVHFFVSLVTVPYQSAIHPFNECQYSLGYYRPGNCAPWLKDPIPFSLSGMTRQALVVVGLASIP